MISIIKDMLRQTQPPPALVVLALGQRKRAYSRDRLSHLFHQELIHLFRRDFDPTVSPFNCELLMTFHCLGRDTNAPILIDANSWKDLLQDVTRIELHKLEEPKLSVAMKIVLGVILLLVALCFLLVWNDQPTRHSPPLNHEDREYRGHY